jgi:hypothetical protein
MGLPITYGKGQKVFNFEDPPCSLLMSTNIIYNQVSTVQGGIQLEVLYVYCTDKDSSI